MNNWIVWNKFFEETQGKGRERLSGNPILPPIYPSSRVRVNELFAAWRRHNLCIWVLARITD
jgi:hypothetical protein